MPETSFQFIARDNAPYGSWIHWSLPHTWTVWQLHRGLMTFGAEKEAALGWRRADHAQPAASLAVANVGSRSSGY